MIVSVHHGTGMKTKMAEKDIEQEEGAEQQEEIIDPPEIDSKYRRIILAAQRSKQIQRGANPRVALDPRKTKPTRIAMKEFDENKVNFSFDD